MAPRKARAAPPRVPPTTIDTVTEVVPLTAPLGLANPPPEVLRTRVDLTRQYIAAGGFGFVQEYARTLPPYIDDVTRDFGLDLYRRMRTDPELEAALKLRIQSIVQNGIAPQAATSKDDPGYAQAQEIAEFVAYCQDNLDRPLVETVAELLNGLIYGYKVAELIWELRTTPFRPTPMLVPVGVHCKPQTSTGLIVDAYNALLGVVYLRPGQPMPTLPMLTAALQFPGAPGPANTGPYPVLLSPEKIWIFANDLENLDWRGQSIFRPAYHAWWVKQQLWVSYLSFLARFGEPILAGYTDPEAEPPAAVEGTVPPTPEQAMMTVLVAMQNGAVGAFPGGAKVDLIESHGDGSVFGSALHEVNREMVKTVTGQTLMTEVSDHMTRAASTTHQDVFGVLVRYDKTRVAANIRDQWYRKIVRYNYGDDAARLYTPVANLGQSEHQDFAQYALAVAALVREGFFNTDQYPGLDNLLSVPARDPKLWAAKIAAEQALLDAQQAAVAQTTNSYETRDVGKLQGSRVAGRLGPQGGG